MSLKMSQVKIHNYAVVDWYKFHQEVYITDVLDNSTKIKGPGVIMEIDESKFGKMKYGRSQSINGKWIFGGMERGTDKYFARGVKR